MFFFRDILLYQKAPQLEETLERAVADEPFQALAKKADASRIYDSVDLLNKAQQQMRFSNHPGIYVEVAVVQLTQTKSRVAVGTGSTEATTDSEAVTMLQSEVRALRSEIESLKKKWCKSSRIIG
ncbi:DNA polymerase III subunits gamma and tau [Listeria floridensis FSL S10-1187]|uniref:DNA polymerase III subunits gamma and tau n=1 Tax=Listeria floridensis FSL S10-1187 TaxID=1265817 RepID=A0ABP3AV32_9LIST|nr:DNA polymerase III subunits gamma and tau [Listeria floridensis FSL S10-1187]